MRSITCTHIQPIDYVLVEWKEGGMHSVVAMKHTELGAEFSIGTELKLKLQEDFVGKFLTYG